MEISFGCFNNGQQPDLKAPRSVILTSLRVYQEEPYVWTSMSEFSGLILSFLAR